MQHDCLFETIEIIKGSLKWSYQEYRQFCVVHCLHCWYGFFRTEFLFLFYFFIFYFTLSVSLVSTLSSEKKSTTRTEEKKEEPAKSFPTSSFFLPPLWNLLFFSLFFPALPQDSSSFTHDVSFLILFYHQRIPFFCVSVVLLSDTLKKSLWFYYPISVG